MRATLLDLPRLLGLETRLQTQHCQDDSGVAVHTQSKETTGQCDLAMYVPRGSLQGLPGGASEGLWRGQGGPSRGRSGHCT